MVLYKNAIIKEVTETRANKDRRFKITRVIVSYLDSEGNEYRKSFEAKDYPEIPEKGTHDEINSKKIQYGKS